MHKLLCLLGTTLLLAHVSPAQEKSELSLTVSPAFRWMTEAQSYGDIRLTNDGTAASEITITVSNLDERASFKANPSRMGDRLTIGDLSRHLTVFPTRLIIEPGETRIVRYAIMDTSPLSDGGHVAYVVARMARRTPVSQQQTPVAAASLRINYEMIVPLILVKGHGEPKIEVKIVRKEEQKVVLALTNHGNSPWGGNVHVKSEDGQQSLGEKRTTLFLQQELEIDLNPETALPDTLLVVFETPDTWIPPHILSPLPPLLVTR